MMGNCSTCFKAPTNNDNSGITSSVGGIIPSNIGDNKHSVERDVVEREETDELLGASPIHLTNINQDRRSGSFKKALVVLNGNTNMGGIITSVKDSNQISDNALNRLFEEYKDENEDAILSDGIERLCCDLGYKPDDFAILVLAFSLDASQMCRFTKTEFIQGLKTMNASNISDIKIRLTEIIEKLKNDSDLYKQLYRFTFRFGLEIGQRVLSCDMAIILWRLVFTLYKPDILDRWLSFLEQHERGVTKDTWNMFLNFAESCDITQYDDSEAWPSLFDDFVEYEKDRTLSSILSNDNKNNIINNNNLYEKENNDDYNS